MLSLVEAFIEFSAESFLLAVTDQDKVQLQPRYARPIQHGADVIACALTDKDNAELGRTPLVRVVECFTNEADGS